MALELQVFDTDDIDVLHRDLLVQEIDGEPVSYGLIPRDYSANPLGSYAGSALFDDVDEVPLIDMDEWPERIAEHEANESSLDYIRLRGNQGGPIPSLNQKTSNYCWAHSPVSAALLLRARDNQPYVRLSAFAVACIIKNFANDGGWNPQALDFIRDKGVPTVEYWAECSWDRKHNNAQTWENAALHKVVEGWIDLQASIYDRTLSKLQYGSCLLQNIPVPSDYMWWRHSVCGCALKDTKKTANKRDFARYATVPWNSWGDGWGTKGMGMLTGSKAWPDGATAPRAITLSDR